MERIEAGRSAFAIDRPGNDFSGMSFRDLFMVNQKRRYSFFNGVDFTNCGIKSTDLQNAEFSETSFLDCEIDESLFDSSDFVDSVFENCIFSNCSFKTGEWRRSRFQSCSFLTCSFERTTMALSEFYSCDFDDASSQSLQHRSIYFNVFSNCTFSSEAQDEVFISRNFGVPGTRAPALPTAQGALLSLEQLCLLYNRGSMRVVDLVDLIETTLRGFDGVGRRRGSTFEFIRLIVRAVSHQKKISPSSLLFIEGLVTSFAATIEDVEIFHAAMAFVIEIRSLLFEISTKESPNSAASSRDIVERITILFKESFERDSADTLVKDIATVTRLAPAGFKVEQFKKGSTLIEMATTGVISLGPLLVGLNFILRQATVTVEHYGKLKRAIRSTRMKKLPPTEKAVAKTRRPATRVGAIVMDRAGSPELEATRIALRRSGRKLVELDTHADIHILAQQIELR